MDKKNAVAAIGFASAELEKANEELNVEELKKIVVETQNFLEEALESLEE